VHDLDKGVLEDERAREVSRREAKRVFLARGVGDKHEVVVLEWLRKHDDYPDNEGVPGGTDGRGRCAVQSGSGSRKF